MTTKLWTAACTTRLSGSDAFSSERQSTHFGPRARALLRIEDHLVHGEAGAHALELRVAGVLEDQAPADLLVEVFHLASARALGVHQGQVGLELRERVAADGDALVEERARLVDGDLELARRLGRRRRPLFLLVD